MKKNTILIIEDNQDDIELLLLAIKAKQIVNNIDIVSDGQEALDYLFCKGKYDSRKPDDLPAIVLLDLQLPKVSGFDILKEMRSHKETESIPVTIFTSSNAQSDIANSYKYGANSFIRKPVDSEKLSKAIEHLGMHWLLLNKDDSTT